ASQLVGGRLALAVRRLQLVRDSGALAVRLSTRAAHERTRMIVFPARRAVALKVATASSRAETLPMFVRNRPSRTRWTISLSWARSDSTTKSTARPSAGPPSVAPPLPPTVPPPPIHPAH